MNETLTTGMILMSEATLVLGVVIAVFLILRARRLSREREMAAELIRRLREQEPDRKEKLLHILEEFCGLDKEASQEKMETLNANEKAIYTRMIRMFLGRERNNISHLDRNVKDLLRGYTNLLQGGDEVQDESGRPPARSYAALHKENESFRVESDKLSEENQRLRNELLASKTAMENMMREYATMFAGGQREGELKVRGELDKLKERDWTQQNDETESSTDTDADTKNTVTQEQYDEADVPDFESAPPTLDTHKSE